MDGRHAVYVLYRRLLFHALLWSVFPGVFFAPHASAQEPNSESAEAGDPTSAAASSDAATITRTLFVFDCSASMATRRAGGPTRFEITRDVLLDVVQQLQGDLRDEGSANTVDGGPQVARRHQIGLMLYGHRCLLPQGDDAGGCLEPVRTGNPRVQSTAEDAELVVEVGDLQRVDEQGDPQSVLQEFERILGSRNAPGVAEPYGETPLYYSMTKAVEYMDQFRDGNNQVVIITDGMNRPAGSRAVPPSAGDVAQALERGPTKVHLIGFDLRQALPTEMLAWTQISTFRYARSNDAARLSNQVCEALGLRGRPVPLRPRFKGNLSGVVVVGNRGVPFMEVVLDSATTDLVAKTDGAGRFEFKNVPLGTYEISASGFVVDKLRKSTTTLTLANPADYKPITLQMK